MSNKGTATPFGLTERRGEQPFLSRVVMENYRSLASYDVALHQLTFLVGPNGSGKIEAEGAARLNNLERRRRGQAHEPANACPYLVAQQSPLATGAHWCRLL